MREFAITHNLGFKPQDIEKLDLEQGDFEFLSQVNTVQENKMHGTTRTSYRPLEKTKMIVIFLLGLSNYIFGINNNYLTNIGENVLFEMLNLGLIIYVFMKKELAWIPFVFLANKTLNMPFVNRHSKAEVEKNPKLRFKDYENTLKACKRFQRSPSTIFSYAEGTRNTSQKHALQNSPYKNMLKPRIGGMATALSAMPNIKTLVDFSLVYKSEKRGSWSFLKGEMKDVKVLIRKHSIPENLQNKNYSKNQEYRDNFKNWIENIWVEKDNQMNKLKF